MEQQWPSPSTPWCSHQFSPLPPASSAYGPSLAAGALYTGKSLGQKCWGTSLLELPSKQWPLGTSVLTPSPCSRENSDVGPTSCPEAPVGLSSIAHHCNLLDNTHFLGCLLFSFSFPLHPVFSGVTPQVNHALNLDCSSAYVKLSIFLESLFLLQI